MKLRCGDENFSPVANKFKQGYSQPNNLQSSKNLVRYACKPGHTIHHMTLKQKNKKGDNRKYLGDTMTELMDICITQEIISCRGKHFHLILE